MIKYLLFIILLLMPIKGWSASMTHGPAVGSVTTTNATFFARTDVAASMDFEYSVNANLSGSTISNAVTTASGSDFTAQVQVTSLIANTTYYYTPRVDAVRALSSPYATFKTASTAGVDVGFSFGYLTDFQDAGGCSVSTSGFISLDNESPDFVYIGGDFDHGDKQGNLTNTRQMHKNNYNIAKVCRADLVTNILRKYWIDHAWDDHDYHSDNANKIATDKANSLQAFKEYFPVTLANPNNGVWHKFSYGNADFFVIDARYQSDANTDTDDANKSKLDGDNLGTTGQLQWLKDSLLASTARWKFILASVPWNPTSKPADSWGAFTTERNALIAWFKTNNIKKIIFLSGDIHMGALDSGLNTDYWNLSITHTDSATCDSTTNNRGSWNKGMWYTGSQCWGYGLIEVLTNPHRVVLSVKDQDGNLKIQGTVLYERATVSRASVGSRDSVTRTPVTSRHGF